MTEMRDPRTWAAFAILAAALLAGGARAGEERDEGRMDRRISVEFKGTAFVKCLDALREKSGVNVVATQKTIKAMGQTPIFFTLKDVSVWSTVHLFARSCELEVNHGDGAFMFSKPVKPDATWATLTMEVDDGEIEIRILRSDVPPGLKRGLVWRVLRERMREEREEEEDERVEREEREGPEKKPGGEKGKPAVGKKGELF
jgi:hypothetical protein